MEHKNWSELWLSYRKRKDRGNSAFFGKICIGDFVPSSVIVKNAREELLSGLWGMLGLKLEQADQSEGRELMRLRSDGPEEKIKETAACKETDGELRIIRDASLADEGFSLSESGGALTLAAGGERGLLYGIFRILRQIGMEQPLAGIDETCIPDNPLRIINHWDNMDGSIERGYSGKSFFFEEERILTGERIRDYARLLCSVGINAVVINNVNVKGAAVDLITERYFDEVSALADVFAGYGISMYLCIEFAAPVVLGGLSTADPADFSVQQWWKDKMKEIHAAVPRLGGFMVKADSEGRPGPFFYGRTQAEGANLLADAAAPYGWTVIWRCFVYNCTQDWRDYRTDRAKAGYDSFIGTDGDYRDNVILQIKNGPMDFQIREPVSPLLGGLRKTRQILEVQVAQEYTGQQIDICYLMGMFKEVLDFHTHCGVADDTVADVIAGRTYPGISGGIAAVINTGNDRNWTGNDLAAANFYGFGRLAFQTSLSPEEIAREWIALTFGTDEAVMETLLSVLLSSRETYEKYTAPLGIGWMVTPGSHYGCSVNGYEYDRWGTYHRADHLGVGVDRSSRGTNYTSQYYPENAGLYDDRKTCPQELLLFFHHIPYVYVLKSGKTLIQHIYDTHFEGVEEVEAMIQKLEAISGKLPEESYACIRERLGRQLANARDWRDQVNTYFFRISGIADEKGRKIY